MCIKSQSVLHAHHTIRIYVCRWIRHQKGRYRIVFMVVDVDIMCFGMTRKALKARAHKHKRYCRWLSVLMCRHSYHLFIFFKHIHKYILHTLDLLTKVTQENLITISFDATMKNDCINRSHLRKVKC